MGDIGNDQGGLLAWLLCRLKWDPPGSSRKQILAQHRDLPREKGGRKQINIKQSNATKCMT